MPSKSKFWRTATGKKLLCQETRKGQINPVVLLIIIGTLIVAILLTLYVVGTVNLNLP